MFPLGFPLSVLKAEALPGDVVLDPFCGRGTTNYAARLLGLPTLGIDSSPVAAALSAAKLANTTPEQIVAVARALLGRGPARDVPRGEFWEWAFHADVLEALCRLREGLLTTPSSDAAAALRGVALGALHGPRNQGEPSYFSNQAQRTYAPKPRYAVGFWRRRDLAPVRVDVLSVIENRAERYYGSETSWGRGAIVQGDSRHARSYRAVLPERPVRWVITSPPYYGMRTYVPDQWLRNWFVGGSHTVEYSSTGRLRHASASVYCSQLRRVWNNVAATCTRGSRLVVRFGGINDRKVDPLGIIHGSLRETPWRLERIAGAGTASRGRRQSLHFRAEQTAALTEYDVWAVLGSYG